MKKKQFPADLGWAVLIALACLFLFGRGLNYGFLGGWDDDAYVFANMRLQWSLENFLYWWRTPLEGLLTPLTANSLMLDAAIWGQGSAAGFRLTNILLHIVTAWLFFSIGRKMRVPAGWMYGIVLCWALHVQRLESVLWIAERKDVLGGVLSLAAWRFMLCRDRVKGCIAAAVCGVLAVFAKPAMAGTAILILAAAWDGRRVAQKNWTGPGIAALLTALAVLPAWWMTSGTQIMQDTFLRKIYVITRNFCWYVSNGVLPLDACPVYPRAAGPDQAFLMGGVLLALLVIWGWRQYGLGRWFRRYMVWMAVWAAFFLPSCGWRVFSNTDYADRYNYLPSLILLYCLALMGRDAMAGARMRVRSLTVWIGVVAVLFALRTWRQIPVWENTESVFKSAVLSFEMPNPKAVEGLGRLGMAASRPDLLQLSGQHFLRLAATAPANPLPDVHKPVKLWKNMGAFYMGLAAYTERHYPAALDWWRELAESDAPATYFPDLYLPVLYGGYADLCLRAGIHPAAQAALLKQMKYLQPEGPAWYRAQGLHKLLAGDEAGALQSLEKALQGMTPADPQLTRLAEALRKRLLKQ